MEPGPDATATAAEAPRLVITPVPGSWLDLKMAEHYAAKAALKEAEQREEDLRREIEAAIASAHEGRGKFAITGTASYPGRNMTWVPDGTKLDTERLKQELPEVCEAYQKPRDGYWDLRPAR